MNHEGFGLIFPFACWFYGPVGLCIGLSKSPRKAEVQRTEFMQVALFGFTPILGSAAVGKLLLEGIEGLLSLRGRGAL